jgi:CheY-like chemotaxis protein
VHEPLEEVPFGGLRGTPCDLELLVRLEVLILPDQFDSALERVSGHILNLAPLVAVEEGCYRHRVATILLVGVDLFFRGKLDVLLQGHHLVTTDTIAEPELVIADISRVEPEEVAETYPDIPIVGFSSHTDTAGLRRAHAAGFDQVLAKSALQERATEVIEELLAPVE